MSVKKKTEELVRTSLPISLLIPNPNNPNRMGDKEFNLLCDNISEIGFVEPVFVKPHPEEDGKYRIIGGHHRVEAAKYLGLEEVPVIISNDPNLDDEMEDFQLVRMNVIHGNIQPSLFLDIYHKYQDKYGEAVLQDLFGFADEAAFRKLIKETKKNLPKEMQKKFAEAAKDIKTLDGLANILNRMFTDYGDTLKYGYMVVDYGGKDSVWLRMSKKSYENTLKLGDICRGSNRTVDDVLGGILEEIAKGNLSPLLEGIIDRTPPVDIPVSFKGMPTEEELKLQGK